MAKKRIRGSKRSPEHQRAVLERRRSGATTKRPSRTAGRDRTRSGAQAAAIRQEAR